MRKWDLPLAHLSRRLLRVIGSLQLAAIAMSAFTSNLSHRATALEGRKLTVCFEPSCTQTRRSAYDPAADTDGHEF